MHFAKLKNLVFLAANFCVARLQPDLNGALFAQRSGAKKREWKADKAAQIKSKNYFSRYRKYAVKRARFTKTAKALERMMGSSSFKTPYHTQSESPTMSTIIIINERSSTFFSFSTLRSCGSIATEVMPPATRPKIFSFMFLEYETNLEKFGEMEWKKSAATTGIFLKIKKLQISV